jgi:hypothetical protein
MSQKLLVAIEFVVVVVVVVIIINYTPALRRRDSS